MDLLPRSMRQLDGAERYGLRVTVLAIGLTVLAIPFGLLLDVVVRDGALGAFDTVAAGPVHRAVRAVPGLLLLLETIGVLTAPVMLLVVSGAATAFLLHRRRGRLAAFVAATALGGVLIDVLVHVGVDRPQPSIDGTPLPAGSSFPSGHAMVSLVVVGALLLAFLPAIVRERRRQAVRWCAIAVLAIGVSRLGTGVHYLSDVIGGWLLGLTWLAASTIAFRIWRRERGRKLVALERGLEPEAASDITP